MNIYHVVSLCISVDVVIILIAVLTFIVSIVAIIAGFGTSTIMIPVLIYFYPLPQVLLLTGVIHWFNDGWRLLFFKDGIWWKRLILAAVPGVIASLIGASLVIRIPQQYLFRALGIMLLLYVIVIYARPSFRMKRTKIYAVTGGAFAGFISGLLGVSGEITSMLLSALDLPKEIFIGTGGAFALIIDVSRVIAYVGEGIKLDPALSWGLIAFIPASLLGSLLGRRVVNKITQSQFRKVIAVFLLIAGLRMALLA
jgi:uncharacterized membrane protein YfcA